MIRKSRETESKGVLNIVKSELIDKTWKNLEKDIEKSKIERTVNTFIQIVGSEIRNGHSVKIEGLGSFCLCCKKPYVGKDINTGKAVKIENARYIRFIPSSRIKPDHQRQRSH